MRGDERICHRCKREGTNGFRFTPMDGHEGVYLCSCTNDSACRRRRMRVLLGHHPAATQHEGHHV